MCNDYRPYLCWHVSCILFFISSFDFNLSKSLISGNKKKITSHHATGFCLTKLDNIYLSQKVDHSLLDLICPSMISKIFSSISITCRLTCIPSLKKYSLWSNCMEYKRNMVWTTTKLKDNGIWILTWRILKLAYKFRTFVGY